MYLIIFWVLKVICVCFVGLRQEEPKDYKPQKAAMSDAEFRNFQDAVGCLIQPQQFRLAVYQAGVETSLRRVVWRHLLNIYPDNMTGRERFDYLKKKSNEYFKLRDEWHGKTVAEDKKNTMNMVKKDVLRTDRHHPFYAGTDENQNVISLFNILVTFALTHSDISYCQGMSDLASPLLVIKKDEASAYVCFCGLMRRLRNNFSVDGLLMTSRFEHLSLLLQHHDPIFHGYLTQHNADLFFCYRWILLEMKREFPLDDALFVLEVMWSTLPIDPPETELDLVDPTYYCKISSPLSNSRCTFNYVQLSKRRLSANQSFCDGKTGAVSHAAVRTPCDEASNTDGSEFCSIKLDDFEEIAKKSSEIEKSLSIHSNQSESADTECSEMEVNDIVHGADKGSNIVSEIVDGADPSEKAVTVADDDPKKLSPEKINPGAKSRVGLDLNLATACYVASQQSETDGSEEVGEDVSLLDSASIDFVKVTEAEKLARLPPPSEFGCGNPFLMFLCLSLLLQHRDHIMSSQMDYNDTAIYYDRMVRRHNAFQVVQQAQSLYGNYLRQQQLESDSSDSPDPSV